LAAIRHSNCPEAEGQRDREAASSVRPCQRADAAARAGENGGFTVKLTLSVPLFAKVEIGAEWSSKKPR